MRDEVNDERTASPMIATLPFANVGRCRTLWTAQPRGFCMRCTIWVRRTDEKSRGSIDYLQKARHIRIPPLERLCDVFSGCRCYPLAIVNGTLFFEVYDEGSNVDSLALCNRVFDNTLEAHKRRRGIKDVQHLPCPFQQAGSV